MGKVMSNDKIEIKNKLESIAAIDELGLNKFSEEIFKKGEADKIKKFIEANPCKYYAIRDKTKAGGIFKLKVKASDIFDEIKDYELFTINDSSANYSDNQLLAGELQILKNGEVYAVLSTKKGYSVRDVIRDPEFNIKTDIFDDRTLNMVPYFDYMFRYIVEHGLEDVIVEFCLFDIEVGVKNECVIVYEVRTHY